MTSARDEAAAAQWLGEALVVERSHLAASPAAVWKRIATPKGINAELMPIARLGFPPEWRGLEAASVTPERPLFEATLWLFGIVPIDRHRFRFIRVEPERGFLEWSSSRTYESWIHERSLNGVAGGCEITDRVYCRARLQGLDRVAAPLLRFVFRHRHRRLREYFGARRA